MNIHHKKIVLSVVIMALMSYESLTIAADSGEKTLGNMVGKVDSYKINCPVNTTRLDFKLFDSTLSTKTNATNAQQLLNAHLKKGKATTDVTEIVADSSKEMILKGGNGIYTLTLDTFGTNLAIKTSQSYSVQYRCLNSAGKDTTPTLTNGLKAGVDSPIKTLKNNVQTKLLFNCLKNKKLGNTDRLYLKLTNKTKAQIATITKSPVISTTSPFLTAQLYNLDYQVATSTTDIAGDDNYADVVSLNVRSGDNYLVIATTATDSTKENAKTYAFQYSCLNDANVEQKASLSQIEDN